jgi:ribosomal protein L37AE/L43A
MSISKNILQVTNFSQNIFSSDSTCRQYPQNQKDRFNSRFTHVNIEYYTSITKKILARNYPKACPHCGEPLTIDIKNRENAIYCPKCFYQGSRTSYTPLHHLKLPLWVFSYILIESLHLYPAVLSGEAIRRRLGVSKNTSTLLKRRLQLFLSDLKPAIKELIIEDIKNEFKGASLPHNKDLTELVKDKPVVYADTVALFSATQRSNGGRSRYKHTGQTASIYLTDEVAQQRGKYQIGTLCHTMAIKQGAVILDSISNQKQQSVQPLFDFLPKDAPIFTDDGYPWMKRYNLNHRAINHSARAKDKKRNVWARERWSKNGVHNQVAEGFQRILKHSFISGYSYINPKYSQLYLNEFSGLKAVKVYGLDCILDINSRHFVDCRDYFTEYI